MDLVCVFFSFVVDETVFIFDIRIWDELQFVCDN